MLNSRIFMFWFHWYGLCRTKELKHLQTFLRSINSLFHLSTCLIVKLERKEWWVYFHSLWFLFVVIDCWLLVVIFVCCWFMFEYSVKFIDTFDFFFFFFVALLEAMQKNSVICANLQRLSLANNKFDSESSRKLGLFLGNFSY